MTGVLHLLEQRRLIDSNGISDGGSVYFYYKDTTNLAPIYSDEGLTSRLTNPVVVGAGAALPVIYLDSTIEYKRYIVYNDGSTETVNPYSIPDYLGYATTIVSTAESVADSVATVAISQAAAESAADLAAAAIAGSSFLYNDTTLAAAQTTGLAAVGEGEQFAATGDDVDYIGVYTDLSGVATEAGRFAKPSYLDTILTKVFKTGTVSSTTDGVISFTPDETVVSLLPGMKFSVLTGEAVSGTLRLAINLDGIVLTRPIVYGDQTAVVSTRGGLLLQYDETNDVFVLLSGETDPLVVDAAGNYDDLDTRLLRNEPPIDLIVNNPGGGASADGEILVSASWPATTTKTHLYLKVVGASSTVTIAMIVDGVVQTSEFTATEGSPVNTYEIGLVINEGSEVRVQQSDANFDYYALTLDQRS